MLQELLIGKKTQRTLKCLLGIKSFYCNQGPTQKPGWGGGWEWFSPPVYFCLFSSYSLIKLWGGGNSGYWKLELKKPLIIYIFYIIYKKILIILRKRSNEEALWSRGEVKKKFPNIFQQNNFVIFSGLYVWRMKISKHNR